MKSRTGWCLGIALAAAVVLVLGTVLAWPREPTRFCRDASAAQAFRDAVLDVEQGQSLALGDLVPFEWDRLWQFSAYDSVDEIERASGLDIGPDSAVRPWCAFRSVVFAHRGEVVAVYSYREGESLAWTRGPDEPYGPDAYVVSDAAGRMICDSAGCPDGT